MNLAEAITIGEDYQLWRHGVAHYEFGQDGQPPMRYTPKEYGEALDILLLAARAALESKPS
jgi:hypothetical protein